MNIPDLAGKVFLVTGASTGIGAAVARALGAQGALVAVHYNRSAEAARSVLADLPEGYGIEADLSRRGMADTAVRLAVERFGRLDGLVNNAGTLFERRRIEELDEAHVDALLDLNVRAVVFAATAAIPHLRRAGGGTIINTTSVAARHGGGAGAVLYGASKGFVSTFTRGLAKELAGDGIRVNAVAPGVIATPLHDRYSTREQIEAMLATIPMRRIGTAEECAGAYLWLASPALSGYVTGQVIEVNGGQLMP
jgi:3-oxoacyl-[acyl-carrier protein] reductase